MSSLRLPSLRPIALCTLVLLLSGTAVAQMIGARSQAEAMRAGMSPTGTTVSALDHRAIENFITVEGKAEKRLDPTALRIVLALLVEQPTASECQDVCRKREAELAAALGDLKIDSEAIVVDFISVLPAYAWEIETRDGKSVAVEKNSGFRMQSNVHVEVPTEEQARAVLQVAFKLGVSDVIAFDYFNKDVDQFRREVRKEALQAAKEKAELLLGAIFEEPPLPLNVHESTRVVYPRSLYTSFENAYAEQITVPYSNDRMPRIKAARPKNTYFRGLQEEADVKSPGLPLRPQISVVSTVRIYFAAPGSDDDDEESDD